MKKFAVLPLLVGTGNPVVHFLGEPVGSSRQIVSEVREPFFVLPVLAFRQLARILLSALRVGRSLRCILLATSIGVTALRRRARRAGGCGGGQLVDEISDEASAGEAADSDRDADAGLLGRRVVAGEEPAAAERAERVAAEGIASDVERIRGGIGGCRWRW